ncbi:MAG: CPBP family intramembrane glutamic endopeptidase [Gemmatimonadales bacterium]
MFAWVENVVLDAVSGDAVGWWVGAGRGLWHQIAGSVVATAIVYAVMVRRGTWDAEEVGLKVPRAGHALWRGLVWGAGMAAGALGLAVVGGARVVTGPAFRDERFLPVALAVLLGLAAAAWVEELLFRGYPLARLAREGGRLGGSVALTVVFVALHLPNPDVTGLGLLNIGLAGLVLSAVFFTGGGLVGAWAVHLGCNAGLALGADAPVSGLRFSLPVLEYLPGQASWWDGGAFGPEGGFAATLVLAAAAIYWMRRLRGNPHEGVMT